MPYISVELAGQKTFGGYLSIDNGQQIELFDDQLIFVEPGTHYISFSSKTNLQRKLTGANVAVGNYAIAAINEANAVDVDMTYNFDERDVMFFTVVSDAKMHILGEPQCNVKELTEEGVRDAERIYAEQQVLVAEVIRNDNQNVVVELILCLFLGTLGVHKFYKKKTGLGILYLLTFGFFGIGVMIDLISIVIRLIKNK